MNEEEHKTRTITIDVNENCALCKQALAQFDGWLGRHRGRYMGKDEQGNSIPGVVLTPDYNASGFLTHYHLTPFFGEGVRT